MNAIEKLKARSRAANCAEAIAACSKRERRLVADGASSLPLVHMACADDALYPQSFNFSTPAVQYHYMSRERKEGRKEDLLIPGSQQG